MRNTTNTGAPMTQASPADVQALAAKLSEPMADAMRDTRFAPATNTLLALIRRGLMDRAYSLTPLGHRVQAYLLAQDRPALHVADITTDAAMADAHEDGSPTVVYVYAARMRRYSYGGHGKAAQAEALALELERLADTWSAPSAAQETQAQDAAPVQVPASSPSSPAQGDGGPVAHTLDALEGSATLTPSDGLYVLHVQDADGGASVDLTPAQAVDVIALAEDAPSMDPGSWERVPTGSRHLGPVTVGRTPQGWAYVRLGHSRATLAPSSPATPADPASAPPSVFGTGHNPHGRGPLTERTRGLFAAHAKSIAQGGPDVAGISPDTGVIHGPHAQGETLPLGSRVEHIGSPGRIGTVEAHRPHLYGRKVDHVVRYDHDGQTHRAGVSSLRIVEPDRAAALLADVARIRREHVQGSRDAVTAPLGAYHRDALSDVERVAQEWHGGQTDPLYAIGSAGLEAQSAATIADAAWNLERDAQRAGDDVDGEEVAIALEAAQALDALATLAREHPSNADADDITDVRGRYCRESGLWIVEPVTATATAL